MHRKIIFIIILFISPFIAIGQISFNAPFNGNRQLSKTFESPLDSLHKHKKKKSTDGLYIGANVGFYHANPYTAQFYQGSGIHGSGNIDTTIRSYYNLTAIKQAFNDDSFNLAQLPAKMHYSPAFFFGIYLKYTIKNSGFFMQFGYTKLTAKDVFTINDYNARYIMGDSEHIESIWGSEERTTIDLGYLYTFSPKSIYRPFIQAGANLTDTKFVENMIKIEGLQYSIGNAYDAYYKINQGGVGFGAFAGCGIDMKLSDAISVMPTFNIYYTHAKMGYLTNPHINYSFYLTVILNGLIGM